MNHLIKPIAIKLNITESQITSTLELLKEGNTVRVFDTSKKSKNIKSPLLQRVFQ